MLFKNLVKENTTLRFKSIASETTLIFSYFIRLTVQFRSAVVDTSAGQAAD
jgi:hypothetical protein